MLYPNKDYIKTLGELQTDGDGRLLVLGGFGIAGTASTDYAITDFANSEGWWDDTSDGTVAAVVEFTDGTPPVKVVPGRVIVSVPGFAPQIPNLTTLWDTIFDVAVRNGSFPAIWENGLWKKGPEGYRPNFRTEIKPLLERPGLYPWVVAIPPKPHNFDFGKLGAMRDGAGAEEFKGLRQWVLSFIRPPYQENEIVSERGATMMPYLAGDNCSQFGTLTSKYMRLTDTQYFFLQQWADGWFIDEPDSTPAPAAITRGVLDNCVGGSFSPGMEMSWISRHPDIYMPGDPFRITAALDLTGPLNLGFAPDRMEPGDINRYSAVPWHSDFNECDWMESEEGRFIWWWPAQRPNYVYLEPKDKADGPDLDTGVPVAWVGTDFDQNRSDYLQFVEDAQMVQYWSGLGFVLEKTVKGKTMYVEVQRTLPRPFFPPSE
jgi:hypothetical protein